MDGWKLEDVFFFFFFFRDGPFFMGLNSVSFQGTVPDFVLGIKSSCHLEVVQISSFFRFCFVAFLVLFSRNNKPPFEGILFQKAGQSFFLAKCGGTTSGSAARCQAA